MINISTLKRLISLSVIAAAFVLVSGTVSEINAQRDPFVKPNGFCSTAIKCSIFPQAGLCCVESARRNWFKFARFASNAMRVR